MQSITDLKSRMNPSYKRDHCTVMYCLQLEWKSKAFGTTLTHILIVTITMIRLVQNVYGIKICTSWHSIKLVQFQVQFRILRKSNLIVARGTFLLYELLLFFLGSFYPSKSIARVKLFVIGHLVPVHYEGFCKTPCYKDWLDNMSTAATHSAK